MRRKPCLAITWCFVSCLVVSTGCSRNWLAQTEPLRPSRYRPTPLESEPEPEPGPAASVGDAARQPVRRRVGDEPPQVSQAMDQQHREDLQKFFAAHPEAIAVTPREILERAGIDQATHQSPLQEDQTPAGSDQGELRGAAAGQPLEIQRPVNPQAQQLLSGSSPGGGGPERLPPVDSEMVDAAVVQASTTSAASPAQGDHPPHPAGAQTGLPTNPNPAQSRSQVATAKTTTGDPAPPPSPDQAVSTTAPSPAVSAQSSTPSPNEATSGVEPNQLAAEARVGTPLPSAEATPLPPANSALDPEHTSATAAMPPAAGGSDESELPSDVEWTELLAEATSALHRTLNQPLGPDKQDALDPGQRARLEAKLRLLQMLADRPDEAMRPIDSLDPDQQRFWTEQVFGLHKLLEPHGPPVDSQRATLALNHLRAGAAHLSVFSKLDLNNIAFCRKVDYYGGYTTFDTAVFQAGQEVLLYVEVDNFAAEEQSRGDVVTSSRPRVVASRPVNTSDTTMYETELRGSYQVLDAGGRQMVDQALPVDKQVCRNRRRDYFIAYRIYLPKDLEDGRYTLQLTMEDAKAKKFGQAWIDFEIEK